MRFPEIMRKYLPLWVALAISLALWIGSHYPSVQQLRPAIPFLLFIMLYPMMINIRVEDIAKAAKDAKLVLVAVLINFLLAPVLGALWAHFLFGNADPYLAAGFILKVTVPCSGMVAAWTGYAKGRVESALIIVALSLLLAIIMVPFWMWALAGAYVKVNPLMIFQKMLFIVVLPLLAGLATRKVLVHRYGLEHYKRNIAPYFPAVSTTGMLAMVFIIIATQANLIMSNLQWMMLVIVGIATLYPVLFFLAIFTCKLLGIGYGHSMALGYSVAAKNHAITIGLATTAFGGTLAVLPAAVAPVIQIPTMMFFLALSPKIQALLHPAGHV